MPVTGKHTHAELWIVAERGCDVLLGAFGTDLTAGFIPTCVIRNGTPVTGEPQDPGRSKTHAFMPQLTFPF